MPRVRAKAPPDGGATRAGIDRDDAMEELLQGLVVGEQVDPGMAEAEALGAQPTGSAAGEDADLSVQPTAVAVVKMKLNSAAKSDDIKRLFAAVARDGNRVLAEAYLFANFHIVRLLGTPGTTLPKIDRNFYYRCILAVSDGKYLAKTLGEDFKTSMTAFDGCRPASDTTKSKSWGCHLNAPLSIQMATMATNSLWSGLEKKVESFVKWKHPELKGFWKPIARYVSRFDPVVDRVFSTSRNTQMHAKRAAAVAVATELRSRIVGVTKWDHAPQAHLLLPLYYHMLQLTEAAAAVAEAEKRKFKGKVFTLLPTKRNYTASFIPVSDMMFKTLLKGAKLASFAGDGRHVQSRPLWRKFMNLNAFETRSRRFARSVTTDGCAIGFLVNKPSSIVAHPTFACGCDNGLQNLSPVKVERTARVVGIDPGFTDVVTVAARDGADPQTYSSKRYYETAKINLSRRRTTKWNKGTTAVTDGFPALRSSTIADYAKYFLANVRTLLEHRNSKGYRNMRFLRYVHRQKAVDEICDMIAPKGVETMVGFGNWNAAGGSPISRRTCGPIEAIKLELSKRPNVKAFVSVHEFRTSVTCHCCRGRVTNMTAETTRVRVVDGQEERTRYRGKVHKVLHCKTSDSNPSGCGASWNRDTNGSLNILEITMCYLIGMARPRAFCRSSTPSRSSAISTRQGPLVLAPQEAL